MVVLLQVFSAWYINGTPLEDLNVTNVRTADFGESLVFKNISEKNNNTIIYCRVTVNNDEEIVLLY